MQLARLMLMKTDPIGRGNDQKEDPPMLNSALIRASAGIDPAPELGLQQVDLVYVRPLGDFRQYEARLLAVVGRFRERIRFTKLRAGELFRFTRERVFLSKTVPNIVLVRRGEVVAQAVGDLPARELEQVVRSAVGCAR